MTLSKELLLKYLPLVWDRFTKGNNILTINQLKTQVLNGSESFTDYLFLEEEINGKSGYVNYEEFSSLILGNSKLIH